MRLTVSKSPQDFEAGHWRIERWESRQKRLAKENEEEGEVKARPLI